MIQQCIDFTNLFATHNFDKYDKLILSYFLKWNINMSEVHVRETK